ncbi:tetratricopeptide repeat protein [Persicimonas caeni]|uniref:tetratricopeptide repeat protein n=1 Tax=Persicimonas caeni TaxID=2292766 RepID=UPI00143D8D21|nr:tetratricopeptide repeat protein [Persicimonas caeni]
MTTTVLLLLSSAPTTAFAQTKAFAPQDERQIASPTEEQHRLNNEAARAIGEGDYTKAVSYLQEALYIGELNITYLNLGRAYQYMGRCEKARETLQKVFDAPALERPKPEFIDAKAREFLAELDESCQSGQEVELAEGGGERGGAVQTPSVDAEPALSGREVLAWSSVAGGLALVGGGVGMHFWAESVRDEVREPREFDDQNRVLRPTQATVEEHQNRANTLDTIGLSMGIVGGVAAITGTYLLVTADDAEAQVSVGPSVDGRGIVIGGRF